MNLFAVHAQARIRVLSHILNLRISDIMALPVAQDVTWVGTTTDHYMEFSEGEIRRLVVDIEAPFLWECYGIWLRDQEVELITP